LIDLKTRAVAPFPPDARTFLNIYKLQKHVLLRHQSYLIVFMCNKNLRFCSLQLINDKIQIIRFYLSLKVSCIRRKRGQIICLQGNNKSMVISFSKAEKWYDKLFNVKYLPLFHHFKAIYQFRKHIIFLVKIVANASLTIAQ
jgi:hypothetical protein